MCVLYMGGKESENLEEREDGKVKKIGECVSELQFMRRCNGKCLIDCVFEIKISKFTLDLGRMLNLPLAGHLEEGVLMRMCVGGAVCVVERLIVVILLVPLGVRLCAIVLR